MKNKTLFQRVKRLKLPEGKYALFGSAPMGVRGLKECNDIDLIVVEELWQELKNKQGWEYKITENGVEHIQSSDSYIEVWHNWRPCYQDVVPFIDNAEIIDGLPFVQLEYVLEWKRQFSREKDLKDVEIIKKFLQIKK